MTAPDSGEGAPQRQAHAHRAIVAAAREFNSGRFFEAHEVLEEALDELDDRYWDCFLGLIQIAVGYHKRSQGLLSGARKMLGLGLEKVSDDVGEEFLHLGRLREQVTRDIATIDAGHPVDRPPRWQPRPLAASA